MFQFEAFANHISSHVKEAEVMMMVLTMIILMTMMMVMMTMIILITMMMVMMTMIKLITTMMIN